VDISRVLIPHLDKYPLLTSEYLNYLTFKKAIKMLENKADLTLQGIEKLKNMASQMNTNRTFEENGYFAKSVFLSLLLAQSGFKGLLIQKVASFFIWVNQI